MSDSVLIGVEARAYNATIRNRRHQLGLTQRQVADLAGVSAGAVGQLETLRQVRMTPSNKRILKTLGLTPDASPQWLDALDLHGVRRIERSVTAEAIGAPTYLQLQAGPDPHTDAGEAEEASEAVRHLTKQERRILEMRHQDGMSWEEISREEGWSTGHIQTITRRAERKLARFLNLETDT